MTHLTPKEILTRAKEFLLGAEYAVQNTYFNVCAICSYAALFWAARAALAYEGLDRPTWKHTELRSKFTKELIENRRHYPRNFGKWLANAYGQRNFAQYHFDPPKAKEIRRMVNHAKEFIQKTEEVLNK
jgi:uncharacterized protein (UPF0332 family)